MGITATPYPVRPKASDIIDSGTLSVTDIAVNHLTEITGGHGVTVAAGIVLHADHIGETTGGHATVCNNIFEATQLNGLAAAIDHLGEYNTGHNIVLNNLETGRQTGTANSVTGAVLAKTVTGSGISTTAGDNVCAVRVIRAGTYKVKVYNWVVFAGGCTCTIYKNASGTVVATTTANNAAYTDEDLGDHVFAAGDVLMLRYDGTAPAGQCMMLSFYNADGMWS